MSEYERNTGRLTPVDFDNKEEFAEIACGQWRGVDLGPYNNYLEMFLDDPDYYGYRVINGTIYNVEFEAEGSDAVPEFCNLTFEEGGVILFDTYHWNGSSSIEEVIGDKLKELSHEE